MKTPFEDWNEDGYDLTGEFEVADQLFNLRSGGLIDNARFATRTKRLLQTQAISLCGRHEAYEKLREEERRAEEKARKQKQREIDRLRKENALRNKVEKPVYEVVQTEPVFNTEYGFMPDPVQHTHLTMRDKHVTRGLSTFTVNGIEFLYGTASVLLKNRNNILAAVGKHINESDYYCDSTSVLQLIIREYKEFTMQIIRTQGNKVVEYPIFAQSDCSRTFQDVMRMWPIVSPFFPSVVIRGSCLLAVYTPE